MAGWIKIDRNIQNHWLWKDKPFSKGQAWVDLILLANHQDGEFVSGSSKVEGKRGTVYRSVLFLADRWGWERKKVKRFLNVLEMDGMLTQNATTHGTTITLVNYGKYQNYRAAKRATDGQPMGNKWATDGHIQEYIKNNKEGERSACAQSAPPGHEGQGQEDEKPRVPVPGSGMDENGFRVYEV